jgi:hypothetical protein
MDVKPSEEYRRFLRQFFLIRYNALLERIKQKIPIQNENNVKNLISVAWIDDALYEVKALPIGALQGQFAHLERVTVPSFRRRHMISCAGHGVCSRSFRLLLFWMGPARAGRIRRPQEQVHLRLRQQCAVGFVTIFYYRGNLPNGPCARPCTSKPLDGLKPACLSPKPESPHRL